MGLKTAQQVAEILGTSPRTVRRWGLSSKIGRVIGIQRLFSESDIAKLRLLVRSGPGNPRMGKGQPEEYSEKNKKNRSN